MITTLIENNLKSIDQATFQKLMNHLLYLEGYKFLGSPGSVVGKNKTSKGSPDTYFIDGKSYVFCEMTTKEKLKSGQSFIKKLLEDVDHCFDTKKTGIENKDVSKVILAFTEKLKPAEDKKLRSRVKKYNSNSELILYSIQEIPFRLIYYPGLADKYIPGVKTTKGTIYTLVDFLATTENGLQPSLTNPFSGRENETSICKSHLLNNDLLILTGGQGVGKSKLGVQLATELETELGFEPRVIVSSPVPIWDDLNSFLLPDKKYLVFFDDANKALPNLDYLLQFVKSRESGSIKIILTVREYVRADLNRYLNNYEYSEVFIKKLDDKQITQIINKSLPTKVSLDPIVIDRILNLSKGNSRLALMAVSSIIKNNDIEILKDVFSLYDQYFQNVRFDVSFLNNRTHLQALGILAFFGVMDRNDLELKNLIESEFHINWTHLWEMFIELEKAEIVDVFYKEAAKISDQVLATFVFYKFFIDETSCSIDFSKWIEIFIENHSSKIKKSLHDLINTFGFNEIKERITSLIIPFQKRCENDKPKLYQYFEIFWFYRELDTLIFLKNWIKDLKQEDFVLDEIKYSYEVNDFVWAPEYISLLIKFWQQNTSYTKEAFHLALELIFKQPSRIPEVLKHLNEATAFGRYDYRYGFDKQHLLLDVLESNEFSQDEVVITDSIFLSKSKTMLGWEYTDIENNGEGEMVIYNFKLVKTDALMKLRKRVLNRLFSLFNDHPIKVIDVLKKYVWTSRSFDSSIYDEEQNQFIQFLDNNLNPDVYSHCKLVIEYLKTLEEHDIEYTCDLSRFTNSSIIELARIFTYNFDEDFDEYDDRERKKREAIVKLIEGKDLSFIESILTILNSIYSDNSLTQSDTYWIDNSISYLFQAMSDTDTSVYLQGLIPLMQGKYEFGLQYGNMIKYPIENNQIDPKIIYDHINSFDYKQKQHWKLMVFEAIPEESIDEFFLKEFIDFISNVSDSFYLYNLGEYIKFNNQFEKIKNTISKDANEHENIVTYVTEILLSKSNTVNIGFDMHVCEKNKHLFTDKIDLLKRIFISTKTKDPNHDYRGKEMAAISEIDSYFLVEYLEVITADKHYLSSSFDRLNLEFIWELDDHELILDKALEIIIDKSPLFSNFEHAANALFKSMKIKSAETEKVYSFISNFISKNHKSKQHILIIMNVVTYCFNDQVFRFLKEFLLLNKDVSFIQSMWLEKNGVFTGSRVPRIEGDIEFTKKLIALVSSLPSPFDYAEHIKYWEEKIEYYKKDKQLEMKRDFKGWGI